MRKVIDSENREISASEFRGNTTNYIFQRFSFSLFSLFFSHHFLGNQTPQNGFRFRSKINQFPLSYFSIRARNSFSLIGIRKGTNRHGVLGDDADLRCDRNHRVPLHQNLLQQRTFYQSISLNFGNYCNNLLLDDVGDCISGTDETTHCTYTE